MSDDSFEIKAQLFNISNIYCYQFFFIILSKNTNIHAGTVQQDNTNITYDVTSMAGPEFQATATTNIESGPEVGVSVPPFI
ncbi:MAG TPA: hypothetical protein ENK96_08105 [Desulfobulbaceae bacterium]|nr:hypothetical protein [Desulfobulbaceae bacterium]